jgi:hypothetical protein
LISRESFQVVRITDVSQRPLCSKMCPRSKNKKSDTETSLLRKEVEECTSSLLRHDKKNILLERNMETALDSAPCAHQQNNLNRRVK